MLRYIHQFLVGHGWLVSYNHSIESRYLFPCILCLGKKGSYDPHAPFSAEKKSTSDVDRSYQLKKPYPPRCDMGPTTWICKGQGIFYMHISWSRLGPGYNTIHIQTVLPFHSDSLGWKLMVWIYDFPFGALNGLCIFRRVTETCEKQNHHCKPSVRSVTSWKTFSKKIPRHGVFFSVSGTF